jgi:hypothetical protein
MGQVEEACEMSTGIFHSDARGPSSLDTVPVGVVLRLFLNLMGKVPSSRGK